MTFCVMCVICVSYHIVVTLPLSKHPLAFKINDNEIKVMMIISPQANHTADAGEDIAEFSG
jgi:hypothetical protein